MLAYISYSNTVGYIFPLRKAAQTDELPGKWNRAKWLGLWCLTPLSTICQLFSGVSFIGVTGENHRPVASH